MLPKSCTSLLQTQHQQQPVLRLIGMLPCYPSFVKLIFLDAPTISQSCLRVRTFSQVVTLHVLRSTVYLLFHSSLLCAWNFLRYKLMLILLWRLAQCIFTTIWFTRWAGCACCHNNLRVT